MLPMPHTSSAKKLTPCGDIKVKVINKFIRIFLLGIKNIGTYFPLISHSSLISFEDNSLSGEPMYRLTKTSLEAQLYHKKMEQKIESKG